MCLQDQKLGIKSWEDLTYISSVWPVSRPAYKLIRQLGKLRQSINWVL